MDIDEIISELEDRISICDSEYSQCKKFRNLICKVIESLKEIKKNNIETKEALSDITRRQIDDAYSEGYKQGYKDGLMADRRYI